MRTLIYLGAVTILISSCGSGKDDCYSCRKDSYYNGINYTDPGPWTVNCPENGESTEAFEARIKEKTSKGYSCKKK